MIEQFVRLALAESEASARRQRLRPGPPERAAVRRGGAPLPGHPAAGARRAGWPGLRDETVGRALGKLHDRPAHAWSLDELAREVGTSRSVLAERFAHFVGVPPMQYLAQWRMQLAATLLSSTSMTLAEIAERVGYGSETALEPRLQALGRRGPRRLATGKRGDPAAPARDPLG